MASQSVGVSSVAALRELQNTEDKNTAKTRTNEDGEDNTTKPLDGKRFSLCSVFSRTSEDARGQRGRREDVVRVVEDVAFRSRTPR
jgi:hypothetical protein